MIGKISLKALKLFFFFNIELMIMMHAFFLNKNKQD